MCGIVACSIKNHSSKSIVNNILQKIKHRGPDHSGIFSDSEVAIGSCRLSIMDLSDKANMPMEDKTGRYVIVYNGEIYNFLQLKKKFNIHTKTQSDTEIVIELYSLLKEKCLDEFNGIFAFIIYDKKERLLFCARDRMGVKPFYYCIDNKNFLASSEIKGLSEMKTKDLNFDYIKTYLLTSFYEFGEDTFYKNIKQLKPSFYLKYFIDTKIVEVKKYWDLKNLKKNNFQKIQTENNLIKSASDLIEDAFRMQMQTDTKLGLNLSSGIDSQLMLHFVNKINKGQNDIIANSFFFEDEQFNERPDLEKISKIYNWKVNFFKINSKDVIDNFDEILKSQEGPFPGLPTIGKSLLIKRSYDNKYKVILEAQGGDDIAGGYKYIFGLFLLDLLKSKKILKTFKEFLFFKNNEELSLINSIKLIYTNTRSTYQGGYSADGSQSVNCTFMEDDFLYKNQLKLDEIVSDISDINNNLDKIIYRDLFYTKLQRILKSCDRASMLSGKELRVPLLDHRLVEFFYKLNNEYKIQKGHLRYLYRKILKDTLIYQDAFKKKKYIVDPQTLWLKNELFDWAYSIFSEKKTFYDGIFNTKKLLDEFQKFRLNSSGNNSNPFWQALCLKRMQVIF
jgi:asparagine synthase (glutamine-hydrolysing)